MRNEPRTTHAVSRRSGCSRRSAGCRKIGLLRPFAFVAGVLFTAGLAGVATLIYQSFTTDEYLYLGAVVSAAFSIIIIMCYARSRRVRFQPNPLIFSKRCVQKRWTICG